jgi:hypothetical protein
MLTRSEQSVFKVFRTFMVHSGEMVCFTAPQLQKFRSTLSTLVDKKLLIREQCPGGYSLTEEGFAAMRGRTAAARPALVRSGVRA